MEMIDWKMAIFGLSLIQFVFTAIIFCVIKFNDLKHLDEDVKKLEERQQNVEISQAKQHKENLNAINKLGNAISFLSGRFDATEEIKTFLDKKFYKEIK